MMGYLKTYKIIVETLAPVFIGSGEKINRKEYVFHSNDKKVLIPDLFKLYKGLEKLNLLKEYENYLLYDSKDLFAWFKDRNVDKKEYQQWMKYSLDSGDAVFEEKGKKEILLFVKDSYGHPYVPGSSLKGALRTALLTEIIMENNNLFDEVKKDIVKAKKAKYKRRYLYREAATIEQEAFNAVRNDKGYNAANDCLAGIRISDSKPLNLSDLVLCQKIDVTVEGKQKSLPVLRECIKPHRKIEFNLTIDTHLCNYSVDAIIGSINSFFNYHKDVFNKAFGKDREYPENSFYLGGGSGYVSKTVTYPLFGEEGVVMASRIIDNTLSFKTKQEHKHYKDVSLGVSPHMLKCTKYEETLYEMGLCKINILENK
ncbi:MAG TPA: type III-A CRISPR-associated RAMP protein Csm5 [Tissierellia bacterium]|nr:type III-A CRISPR-associated RAMP protein Csm5 [Tissierellia bacterium]